MVSKLLLFLMLSYKGDLVFKTTRKISAARTLTAFIFLMVATPQLSSAQNKCLDFFKATTIRISAIREIDFTRTPEYEDLLRRFPGLKPVAQYEQTGTLVLHTASLPLDGYHYFESLLTNLPSDVRTVLVGSASDYDSAVRFNFTHLARGTPEKPLDTFLRVDNESKPNGTQSPIPRWVQDHLGQFVTYNGWDNKPVVSMVTASYRFQYQVSEQLAKFFGVKIIKNISGNHEWGNFIVMGDTGYLLYGSRTHSDLRLEDFMYTGIRKLVILPQPEFQSKKIGIPHVDEFIIPLSKDHVLTNLPEFVDYFRQQGKQVELLPSNADVGFDYLTYTNAVLVNGATKKVLFVPQFGRLSPKQMYYGQALGAEVVKKFKARDKEALRIYRAMAVQLGITVVPVHAAKFTLNQFGGLHCATGICTTLPNADKAVDWYSDGDVPL